MEEKKLSNDAQRVQMRFNQGLWTKMHVRVAVKKGVITKEEYKLIIGEDY